MDRPTPANFGFDANAPAAGVAWAKWPEVGRAGEPTVIVTDLATITVAPTLAAARELRARLDRAMIEAGVDAEIRLNVLLAASEIMVNLVRHATPTPTEIIVQLGRRPGFWTLDVLDNSVPFKDVAARMRAGADPADTTLRERGSGLRLVARMFPVWQYGPSGPPTAGWNRFRVSAPAGRATPAKPHVLVVDDDPVICQVIRFFLREHFAVHICTDAARALVITDELPIALIISDIVMPGLDGIAFRERLAERGDTDVIPFIFYTSRDDPETREKAAALGIDDYLIKPLRKGQLLAVARRVLNRSRGVRARLGDRLDARITSALHPSLPTRLGPCRAALRTWQATAGGGDLVVHRRLEDGDVVIVVDMMGHGEQAKFFAHACAGYLHGMLGATAATNRPKHVLRRLSEAFRGDRVLRETLATCLAVCISRDGEIRAASGGHPPPLIVGPGGVVAIPVTGPLPGLSAADDYREVPIDLGPGERVALYTDGLFEIGDTPESRLEAEDAMIAALRASARLPIEKAIAEVGATFEQRTGGAPADDATLILLERSRGGAA